MDQGYSFSIATPDIPIHEFLYYSYIQIYYIINNSYFLLYCLQDPYVLKHLTFFANMCVIDLTIHEKVNKIIDETCSKIPKEDTQKKKRTLKSVS